VTGVAVRVRGLGKHFGPHRALENVTFDLRQDTITGLLGRNGAGKTTLMRILTGQAFASTGEVEVFGHDPLENDAVLPRIAFVSESQRYPDPYRVRHVLRAAELLFPNWDADLADSLVDDFDLPRDRAMRKLSRGMVSSVGIVVGLASRAPLTLFDEPYLGLDAAARQLFYDRLLADYAEHPRTVLLSTHLIDEVSDLIEHVLLIDHGRMVMDEDADTLRGRAVTVSGPAATVERFTAGREMLHRQDLGGLTRVTVVGAHDDGRARELGLSVEPVSLQQFVVRTTTAPDRAATDAGTEPALAGSLGGAGRVGRAGGTGDPR
jgi:ABC-2 type transport system ATP-binding protein